MIVVNLKMYFVLYTHMAACPNTSLLPTQGLGAICCLSHPYSQAFDFEYRDKVCLFLRRYLIGTGFACDLNAA